MKNFDVVQLIVLIIAIFAGYHVLIEIPQLLWMILQWFGDGLRLSGYFTPVVTSTIYLLINIVIVLILVNKSRQIIKYIIDRSAYHGELKLNQTKDDLLSVLFIAIGVYLLTTRLPRLFMALYNYFKEKNMSDFPELEYSAYLKPTDSIPLLSMEVVFAIIIIVYSQQFTDYFSRQISHTDVVDEIGSSEK